MTLPHSITPQVLLTPSTRSRYHDIFLITITAGLRKGVFRALHWKDITPQGIHVRRTTSAGAPRGFAPPKTRAGKRFIPLDPTITTHLLRNKGNSNDLVFVTPSGMPVNERNVTRALHHHLRELGQPVIRFHDLRRTYATLLTVQGTHPRVIQKLLGHSTPHLAMSVYTDVLAGQEREAVIGGVYWGRSKSPTGRNGPPQYALT
jgi:integrase